MRRSFARHQTPFLLIAILGLIAAASALSDSDSVRVTLTEMFIRITVVIGLYVFIGNSGIISFGQIGFMCIGAYAAAWATADPSFKQIMLSGLPTFLQENQYPFLVAMAGSLVLPAAVALCLGAAIMRLSGTAASIAWYGPFWATVTKLVPVAAAGAGMGLINGVGNLGSFFGPYIGGWLSDLSGGGYALTQAFFGGVFGIAALLVLTLRKQLRAATNLESAGAEKEPKEKEPAPNPV